MTALLLVAALGAMLPGQGRINNGQLETRTASQPLEREIAATTARGGARWVAYRIRIVGGRRSMDCFDRATNRARIGDRALDPRPLRRHDPHPPAHGDA